jgi:hypothetical protein
MNLDPGAGTKDLVANLPAVPEGSRVFSAHRFGADGKGELCKRVLNSSRSVFVWSSKLADTLSRRKCTRENGQMGATGSLGNVSESSRGAGRPPAPTERCCADAGAVVNPGFSGRRRPATSRMSGRATRIPHVAANRR